MCASPGRIWSRPVSPGWSPPNPDVTNPGCLTGVLFGARFSWNWICGCIHARQPWQRSDHAGGTRLFRGSDKAAKTFCQSLSTSYGNRERRSGFGRVTGSSLASRPSTVPTGSVRSSWDGLGTGAPPGLLLRQPRSVNRLSGRRSGPGHRISRRRDE